MQNIKLHKEKNNTESHRRFLILMYESKVFIVNKCKFYSVSNHVN